MEHLPKHKNIKKWDDTTKRRQFLSVFWKKHSKK
jgi:hypothetical protein